MQDVHIRNHDERVSRSDDCGKCLLHVGECILDPVGL